MRVTCDYERAGDGSVTLVPERTWRFPHGEPITIAPGPEAELWLLLVSLSEQSSEGQTSILDGIEDATVRARLLAAIGTFSRWGCLEFDDDFVLTDDGLDAADLPPLQKLHSRSLTGVPMRAKPATLDPTLPPQATRLPDAARPQPNSGWT